MRCECGRRKDPRSLRCRSCASRTRWEQGRVHRIADRPLPATLCRCESPLIDGEDECVWCGHLILPPDTAKRCSVHAGVKSSMGQVIVLPNVIHHIGVAA